MHSERYSEVEPRTATNSKEYVAQGYTSAFQALPPAPTLTEETFEDKVVIEIESEKYEIIPVSHKRVKVIRHYEEAPVHTGQDIMGSTEPPATAGPPITYREANRESHRTGPDDKKNVAASMALIAAPRVTHDPEMWDMLERLRAERQTITIELPAGYSLSRGDQRKLKKLVDHILHDRIKESLELLPRFGPKIDESKVIEEHPGLISSFKERLAALVN